MDQPLVSILTPFKNTAPYLKDCLNSIMAQSYDNWELLLVNDGSTDHSLDIVNSYSSKDARIKVFQNNGSGIIKALRLAFENSDGQFITRMDSDDIMAAKKIEILVSKLLEKGSGHVSTGLVKYFSEKGISDGYDRYEKWLNELTRKGANYSEIYKECVIASPCWMVSREDLIKCQAFEPNRYPEDYDLTFRFYQNGLKCIPCDELLHHWRDYDTRTSRTHIHYAQNYFLDIKLHYFLNLHYDKKRPLTIWGAGFKGKTIAKQLVEHDISFYWICDNPKKIGKSIYGQPLLAFEELAQFNHPQSIVTVANEAAQKEIRSYLHAQEMKPMEDYFFFC